MMCNDIFLRVQLPSISDSCLLFYQTILRWNKTVVKSSTNNHNITLGHNLLYKR